MAWDFDYEQLSEQQLRSLGTREAAIELQRRAGPTPLEQAQGRRAVQENVPPGWMAEGQVQYPEETAPNVQPSTQDVSQPGLVEFGRALRKPIDERFQQLGREVAALPEPSAPVAIRETVGKFGERSFTDQPEGTAPRPGGNFVKAEGGQPAPPATETFGPMDAEIRGLMARLRGLDAHESVLFSQLEGMAPGDPRRGAILDVIQRALPEHRKQALADLEQRTTLGAKMFGLQEKATEAVAAPTKREIFKTEKGLKEKEIEAGVTGRVRAGAEAAEITAGAERFKAILTNQAEQHKANLVYQRVLAEVREKAEEADKDVLRQAVLPLMQSIITEKKDGKAPTSEEVFERMGRMGEGLGKMRKGLRGQAGARRTAEVKVGEVARGADGTALPPGMYQDRQTGRKYVVGAGGKVVRMQ